MSSEIQNRICEKRWSNATHLFSTKAEENLRLHLNGPTHIHLYITLLMYHFPSPRRLVPHSRLEHVPYRNGS